MEPNNQNTPQQVVESSIPVVAAEKKNNFKWIWILLLIVILAIGLIYLYFYLTTGSFNIKSTTQEKQTTVTPTTIQQSAEDKLRKEVEALDLGDIDNDLKDVESVITSLK